MTRLSSRSTSRRSRTKEPFCSICALSSSICWRMMGSWFPASMKSGCFSREMS
ncbi:hypothetical protein ACN28S_20720 [Cystobacter fuscus]